MGKLHRIKKHFWRIVSQKPLPVGYYCLANTTARIHIGKRQDGSYYMMQFSSTDAYKGLVNRLIQQYEDGVALSDRTSIKK